jgi:hypothetical protein
MLLQVQQGLPYRSCESRLGSVSMRRYMSGHEPVRVAVMVPQAWILSRINWNRSKEACMDLVQSSGWTLVRFEMKFSTKNSRTFKCHRHCHWIGSTSPETSAAIMSRWPKFSGHRLELILLVTEMVEFNPTLMTQFHVESRVFLKWFVECYTVTRVSCFIRHFVSSLFRVGWRTTIVFTNYYLNVLNCKCGPWWRRIMHPSSCRSMSNIGSLSSAATWFTAKRQWICPSPF